MTLRSNSLEGVQTDWSLAEQLIRKAECPIRRDVLCTRKE